MGLSQNTISWRASDWSGREDRVSGISDLSMSKRSGIWNVGSDKVQLANLMIDNWLCFKSFFICRLAILGILKYLPLARQVG